MIVRYIIYIYIRYSRVLTMCKDIVVLDSIRHSRDPINTLEMKTTQYMITKKKIVIYETGIETKPESSGRQPTTL